MPPKASLRQRHGSDALRLSGFEKGSSPYDTDEDAVRTDTNNTPPSRSRAVSPRRSTAVRPPHHRSVSSGFLSPRIVTHGFEQQHKPQQPPLAQPISPDSDTQSADLPFGARTPNLEDDHDTAGLSIVYPPAPPTWTNMPNKGQLAILTLSRFVDFFQMAALQTYMVHQLKSFDPSLPDSVISHQAGVLLGSFTAAQIITSILWGRAADQPGVGRKLVLNIGLVGTGITMLGVGFSTSYKQAVTWRVLGGAINGTVGAARTMVAESVDKRYHPRAFLLLPAAFNFANVAGPSESRFIIALPPHF